MPWAAWRSQVLAAPAQHAARAVAELRAQRVVGDGSDAIPELGHERAVSGPGDVFAEDVQQNAVLVQLRVVAAPHLARVQRRALGGHALRGQAAEHGGGEGARAELGEGEGGEGLVPDPLAVVLPDAAVHAAASGHRGGQLRPAGTEEVVEDRLVEGDLGGSGMDSPRVRFGGVGRGRRDAKLAGHRIEVVDEPHARAGARLDGEPRHDGGSRNARAHPAHLRVRRSVGDRHFTGQPRARRRRAVEPLLHREAAGAPGGDHRRHGRVRLPRHGERVQQRAQVIRRRDQVHGGRLEAEARVHRQRVALLAQPLGVHDEQGQRRALAPGGVLHGGLDEAVAEDVVVHAGEPRAHIRMPLPGVVVVDMFRDVYHGQSLGSVKPPPTSTTRPVE